MRTLVAVAQEEQQRIGERIARARRLQGWSQDEFARRLGLKDARHIRYWESGQRSAEKYLKRMAELTGYPVDWFYGEPIGASAEELAELRRDIAGLTEEIRRLRRRDSEDGGDPVE